MLRIRKDDKVIVIAGKDKGKTGKVIGVFPKTDRVLVENINIVKKARRKTQKNPQGGIVPIEIPLHISNVMLLDNDKNKPTRIGISFLTDGTKVRIAKKSGEPIK